MGTKDLTYAFVKELEQFTFELSSSDRIWNIIFPDRDNKWNHLHVIKYKRTFYVTNVDGHGGSLEAELKKHVRVTDYMGGSPYDIERSEDLTAIWASLIASAGDWLKTVRKDWVKANKRVLSEYPLNRRYGIVPNALLRASLPEIHRPDKELGKAGSSKLVRLVEDGYFLNSENMAVKSMTANDYFNYCRIAYRAARRKQDTVDESLSGREMYVRYADGRHEGLLDIDPSSEQEFTDWIDGKHPKRSTGGHPWEIKRGGNTTHIDLYVMRSSSFQRDGFKIELRGESIVRMVETMRMFLAIHEAGLPISIADPEGLRKRLLAQDNIGIIPVYAIEHRANQHFDHNDNVYDVIHYDDLGRFKRRITPFITWEPLSILKPRDI